jgi:hypothetical protein
MGLEYRSDIDYLEDQHKLLIKPVAARISIAYFRYLPPEWYFPNGRTAPEPFRTLITRVWLPLAASCVVMAQRFE